MQKAVNFIMSLEGSGLDDEQVQNDMESIMGKDKMHCVELVNKMVRAQELYEVLKREEDAGVEG